MSGRRSVICPPPGTAAIVALQPADNVARAVAEAPPGTTFCLAPGLYRGVRLEPKANDRIIGSPGNGNSRTVLNGAILLAGPWTRTARGEHWIGGLPPPLAPSGVAAAGRPLATHPQDLFVDGVLYRRAEAPWPLAPGTWFFDEAARRAYLADDPAGHVVELGQAPLAIGGNAPGVVLANLIVERYAAPAQFGAIVAGGDRWVLQDIIARQNHGEGVVAFGRGIRIEGGAFSENGQEGISGYRCDGLVIENATVERNNAAGFDTDWQAGGIKVSAAANVTYAGNRVIANAGIGIWNDAEMRNATVRDNIVSANLSTGIMDELSERSAIIGNTVIGNGAAIGTAAFPAGILLQNSSDAEVRANHVETSPAVGHGIMMTYEPRGSGSAGPYRTDGNIVRDNTVVFAGAGGYSGFVAYSDAATAAEFRNAWLGNTYVVSAPAATFNLMGDLLTLAEAQERGYEQGSRIVRATGRDR
jgi:hypothetical protein